MEEKEEVKRECPNCKEASRVRLISTNADIGTLVGSGLGFGCGWYGAVELGWKIGRNVGACVGSGFLGGITGSLLGGISGLVAGASLGNSIGHALDRYVVCKYICETCNHRFSLNEHLESDYIQDLIKFKKGGE